MKESEEIIEYIQSLQENYPERAETPIQILEEISFVYLSKLQKIKLIFQLIKQLF